MTALELSIFISASFLANLALTPSAIRISARLGLLDFPGHRKIHSHPVPKLGGVALLLSIGLGLLTGLRFGLVPSLVPGESAKLGFILSAVALAALLGFLDDLFDWKPRRKLAAQALICGAFALFGFHFGFLHIPGFPALPLYYLGVPLTMFWMMAVINGFNFMDGVDGLAGSVSAACLCSIGLAALGLEDRPLEIVWMSALGALLVFLIYNRHPAKIYLGDAGSNALGMLVAASLTSLGSGGPAFFSGFTATAPSSQEPARFHLFAATLLAGYAILEVGLSTLRRGVKRFFYGRSMSFSEKEHIHHRLMQWGLGAPAICAWAVLFQAPLAAVALLVLHRQNALAIWLLVPLVMALAYLLPRFGFLDFMKPSLLDKRHHFLIAHHFISMQKSKLGLVATREEALLLAEEAFQEFGVHNYHLVLKPGPDGAGGVDSLHHRDLGAAQVRLTHLLPAPEEATGSASDSYQLPGGRGWARWVFDHLKEQEEELDVECRVLVNEFVRRVLETAVKLHPESRPSAIPAAPAPSPSRAPSGHSLRQRNRRKVAPSLEKAGLTP